MTRTYPIVPFSIGFLSFGILNKSFLGCERLLEVGYSAFTERRLHCDLEVVVNEVGILVVFSILSSYILQSRLLSGTVSEVWACPGLFGQEPADRAIKTPRNVSVPDKIRLAKTSLVRDRKYEPNL